MWIILDSTHLLQGLSGPEVTALSTLQLSTGQTDPVPEVLMRVTFEVRGYIAANHGTLVGEPGKIPEELLSSAIAIARYRLLGRLPVKSLMTDSRRKEYEDAITLMRDVAAGKFAISITDEPAEEQPRKPANGNWGSAAKI